MKIKNRPYVGMFFLTFLSILNIPVCKADGPYHLLKAIPARWEGGCDSLLMDEIAHRLYVVHGTKIEIIDLRKESIAGEITNAVGIRGFALAPRLRRAFLSNGQEPKMDIIDLLKLETIQSIKTDKNPGAILFDPGRAALYAFNKADNSVSIFEADDGDYVATIKLPGSPGVAVADQKTGRIYCGLEDKDELIVIDPNARRIINQWAILPKEGISAMAIDSLHHRIFLGCRNQTVLMADGNNGAILSAVPVDGEIGAMAFDPVGEYLFVSAKGTLTIVSEYTQTELKLRQTLGIQGDVQRMALDLVMHRIYLAAKNLRTSSNMVSDTTSPEAKTVSDNSGILMYGREKTN